MSLSTPTDNGQIVKIDPGGRTEVVSAPGHLPGQVGHPIALAVGRTGDLFVSDHYRVQRRDARGEWSVLAPAGTELDGSDGPTALETLTTLEATADGALIAPVSRPNVNGGFSARRIGRWAPGEGWTTLATHGPGADQIGASFAMTTVKDGSLYLAKHLEVPSSDGSAFVSRLRKRGTDGSWSVLPTWETGTVSYYEGVFRITADDRGNVYVLTGGLVPRFRRRDASGTWTTLAAFPSEPDGFGMDLESGPDGSVHVGTRDRIVTWDAQGNRRVVALPDLASGESRSGVNLETDAKGRLVVEERIETEGRYRSHVRRLEPDGLWTTLPPTDAVHPTHCCGLQYGPLVVDAPGNVYFAIAAPGGVGKVLMYPATRGDGDLNGDGALTLVDARLALRIVLGLDPATTERIERGDIAPRQADGTVGDRAIRMDDTVRLLRRAVGLDLNRGP